jgi:uncharacterized membrane protein
LPRQNRIEQSGLAAQGQRVHAQISADKTKKRFGSGLIGLAFVISAIHVIQFGASEHWHFVTFDRALVMMGMALGEFVSGLTSPAAIILIVVGVALIWSGTRNRVDKSTQV